MVHEWLAGNKPDVVGAAFELPEVAIARRVDEAFDRPVAMPVIDRLASKNRISGRVPARIVTVIG